jgi:hypothetical protein
VWTEQDDKELKYGKWNVYTAKSSLVEQNKVHPPEKVEEIWPHWSEGVPGKLCWSARTPGFSLGPVYHRGRSGYETIELNWNAPQKLAALKSNYHLLPRDRTSEWNGVYRIFSPNATIDRCCGRDPTGTLYLGLAGSRGRNWSILRTRILSIVNRNHHAIEHWCRSTALRQQFPWESLCVEWAYTGTKVDHKGEAYSEAITAETVLLRCYNDSYGEYPPWNQRG